MKICMYGAGATGCTIAKRLFETGADVSLIARGENLQALQNGLRFISNDGEQVYPIAAHDIDEFDQKQDVIILAAKGYNTLDIAPNLKKLLHDDTIIIPSSNGIPWWFFYGSEGPLKDLRLKSVNSAEIDQHIDFERIIGGIFYMSASQIGPGTVKSIAHENFTIGEPDHLESSRVKEISSLLSKAGFKKVLTDDIHKKIWWKLCWNVPFNPLSVIYNKDSKELIEDPECWDRMYKIVEEIVLITEALGTPLDIDINKVIGFDVGSHKPSMMQDYEKGKQLEIEDILGSVVEISEHLELDSPYINSAYNELKHVAS